MEESPLSRELFILLNLIMNGSSHKESGFSLPLKALSKIFLYNHRIQGRRRESSAELHQRHNADKAPPFFHCKNLILVMRKNTQNEDIIANFEGFFTCRYMLQFGSLRISMRLLITRKSFLVSSKSFLILRKGWEKCIKKIFLLSH